MELRSLYIEFHLCLNASAEFRNFSGIQLFGLITISINLFDQLVIVICDLVMER